MPTPFSSPDHGSELLPSQPDQQRAVAERAPTQQEERLCPNCGKKGKPKWKFCPSCGQRTGISRLRLRTLISDALREEFHLNGKTLLSLRLLALAPGQLTQAYLAGMRKSLLSPVKLFLWAGFLLLAVMIPIIGQLEVTVKGAEDFSKGFQEGAKLSQVDLPPDSSQALPPVFQMDSSTREQVFGSEQDTASGSLSRWKAYRKERLKKAVELANQDPAAFLQHSISNFPYVLITILPFFSLLFTLAYHRRGLRFLDHLIFLLNQHSLLFLVLAAAIGLFHLGLSSAATTNVLKGAFFLLVVHNLLAFKRVYGHSWAGTIFIGGLIGFLYLLTAPVIMLIISILVGLLS